MAAITGLIKGVTLPEATLFLLTAAPLTARLTAKTPKVFQFWMRLIPIVCGGLVLAGDVLFVHNQVSLICFLMAGLAIMLPRTTIRHRFHAVQLLALLVMIVGWTAVTAGIYRYIVQLPMIHFEYISLNLAILFTLLGEAVLLRWPNRGWVGIFNSDTLASIMAFRLLIINALVVPVIALGGVIFSKITGWNVYETGIAVVMLQIVVLVLFTWLNVRVLYRFELEHLVFKEALNIHNAGLKFNYEQLEAKVTDLETAKQKYAENLNYQERFRNLADYFD
jgi:hypothetical protein